MDFAGGRLLIGQTGESASLRHSRGVQEGFVNFFFVFFFFVLIKSPRGAQNEGARHIQKKEEAGGCSQASDAGESEKVWRSLKRLHRRRKAGITPQRPDLEATADLYSGGQGVHGKVGIPNNGGNEEKYRGPQNRWGKPKMKTESAKKGGARSEVCTSETKAFSFTHRTKV